MYLLSFTIGLVGGIHCVGMCGPLQMATTSAPVKSRWKWFSFRLTYQLGRIFIYGLLGLFIALLGQAFVLGGWQNILSITIGCGILVYYLLPNIWKGKTNSGIYKGVGFIKKGFSKYLRRNTLGSQISMGMLNGLLPCGLVYLALANAALSESIFQGFLNMAIFGSATIPWLMAVLLLGSFGQAKLSMRLHKATPYLAVFIGVLLILRGFDVHFFHTHYLQTLLGFGEAVEVCE